MTPTTTEPIIEPTQSQLQEAKKLGVSLANSGFSTSQIRRFLSQVNQYRHKAMGVRENPEEWEKLKPRVEMLEPRLVYQIVKTYSGKPDIIQFKNLMCQKLKVASQSPEAFLRFADFLEAVVAYHKEAGGKDT
jgi:CRISPR-associated protein Csm2